MSQVLRTSSKLHRCYSPSRALNLDSSHLNEFINHAEAFLNLWDARREFVRMVVTCAGQAGPGG